MRSDEQPYERSGYLGEFQLWRGSAPDSPTVFAVRCDDGKVRYYGPGGERIILRPTDRKSATAVIEDGYPLLRGALEADRWTKIVPHG